MYLRVLEILNHVIGSKVLEVVAQDGHRVVVNDYVL